MIYVTPMFPYPSGDKLHVGHYYNYAILDSYCNYLRYMGNQVFQPFGYDSFGLPTENYAIKVNKSCEQVTNENINSFRLQIKNMNTSYEELLITSSKSYQISTQKVFNILLKRGLAYKKVGLVNWDPIDKTVLANEQVKNGIADRSGAQIELLEMNQWYFKITDYKDRLIKNLDFLDYPESTKKQQRHWLNNLHDWCVSRQRSWGCPIPIQNEVDTLDTFVDSSFYTIQYCLLKGIKPIPVDLYVGGSEHACMHLIYARFITMVLHDEGLIDFEEPFKKVIHQGMILNNGEKMSKSKNNTVNLDNYDSDTIRFYLMFLGHYFDGGTWDDSKITGITRFINRLITWLNKEGTDFIDLTSFQYEIFNQTKSFKFNKVVSAFMVFYNVNKHLSLDFKTKKLFLKLLQIYMPDIESKINHGYVI